MATLLGALATTAKAVADTVKKKKEESTLQNTTTTSTGGSSGTTRTAQEAAASGDFETPFNGKHRTGTLGSSTANNLSSDYGLGTYKQDLDRLTKAQRQAQVDELKAARTQALANLDVQEQNIKPTYEAARNQTAATSQQGARNFAEYLANRGLTNSGAAAQGEINRLSALQNNLGNLNTAEANAYRDIANQRTAVENNYVSGLANANNAITNNYYNNLLNYNEQQRQLVNNLKQQALGQYAGDYQAYMNTLNPNSMEWLYAAAARGNKVSNANAGAYTYQNAMNNIASGNYSYNDLLAAGMTKEQADKYRADLVAANEAQQQKELEQLLYDRGQQEWENAYKENQLNWNQNMDYNNYLLNQQKVANDTAQTQATIANLKSQIAKRNQPSEPKTTYLSYDKVINMLPTFANPQATVDAMVDEGLITDGTWRTIYADHPEWKKNIVIES